MSEGHWGPEMFWSSQRGREASLAGSGAMGAFKGAHELSAFIHDSNHPQEVEGNHFQCVQGDRERGVEVKTLSIRTREPFQEEDQQAAGLVYLWHADINS